MKKNIILIVIIVFSANLSMAQFICNISDKVKEAGDAITKEKGNSTDTSIIGDYRKNGTGWVLLPDHTGAVFIENIQVNEIIWVLGNMNGNQGIEITNLKKELDSNNRLQAETQIKFLINIKSITEIEFLNTQTLQTTKLKRTLFIPGKAYSKIQNKDDKQKPVVEGFSVFQKKYIDEKISNWQTKGEFEKTADWQIRVNEETTKEKIEGFKEDAINAYAKRLHIKLGFCYIGASLSLGKYDADKEVYIIKSRDFGDLELPVPINEAEQFKFKNWCGSDSDPTNVIYFIINDELSLAEATFWDKYKYVNPLAKNRNKTKNEIAMELQAKKELDDMIYSAVEKKPNFPGGMEKFYKYVAKNYKNPEEDLRGKVYVTFIVEKDGSLTDIKVIKDIGYGTGKEVIRVLSSCPKWIPGEQNGQKVRVLHSLIVNI